MKKFIIYLFALLSALVLTGCGTTRQVAVVDRVHQDTIYINQTQYDSIFISQDRFVDRSTDTLYIRDISIQYKYKILRDTVRIHKIDSIPVVKEVEIIKMQKYTPWYAKAFAWIGAIALILFIIFLTVKIIKWKINI